MDKNKITKDLSLPEKATNEGTSTDIPGVPDDLAATINAQNMGEGTFLFNEEPDEEEIPESTVQYKSGNDLELLGDYSEELINDIIKNPAKYKFVSKKHGQMNLKEAIDKGYNPDTDEFDKPKRKSKEQMTEGLSDSDKESIDKITDPSNAKVPAKDAEAFGISDERMIAKDEATALPKEGEGVTVPPEGGAPVEWAEGGEDMSGLMALLGGGE